MRASFSFPVTALISVEEGDKINSISLLVALGFAKDQIDILSVLVEAKKQGLREPLQRARVLLRQQPVSSLVG